jgi:thiamine-monophosphate kinase
MAVPRDTPTGWLDGLYRGVHAACEAYGVTVVGGDTASSPSGRVLTLTLTGRVERERLLRRDGARPGDRVLVSGTLGDSAGGLVVVRGKHLGRPPLDLSGPDEAHLLTRHLRPVPRVALARALAAHGGVRAAIDLSDGLAADAAHIARRSGVGLMLDYHALPLSPALRALGEAVGVDPRQLAFGGGEDYELCIAAAPDAVAGLQAVAASEDLTLTDVGCFDGEEGFGLVGSRASDDEPARGWDHFG